MFLVDTCNGQTRNAFVQLANENRTTSVSVLAETSVRSPRKMHAYIVKIENFWINYHKGSLINFENKITAYYALNPNLLSKR